MWSLLSSLVPPLLEIFVVTLVLVHYASLPSAAATQLLSPSWSLSLLFFPRWLQALSLPLLLLVPIISNAAATSISNTTLAPHIVSFSFYFLPDLRKRKGGDIPESASLNPPPMKMRDIKMINTQKKTKKRSLCELTHTLCEG